MHKPKVLLVIMDGWGYSPIKTGNAILNAKTPTFDYLWDNYAHLLLSSFGENVGLPWGSIGSSEVGHISIGSGRLVDQELTRIDKEIATGDFFRNKELLDIIKKTKGNEGSLHLAGLISDGGVHSHIRHLIALLKMLKDNNFRNDIFVHAFADGRDVTPQSIEQYLNQLQAEIEKIGLDINIATLTGRYYAMDRDSNWDRIKKAYLAMTERIGLEAKNYHEAIKNSYHKKILDEQIKPYILDIKPKKPAIFDLFKKNNAPAKSGKVEPGDGMIFFNIRPDRMRQIVEMFLFVKKEIGTNPVPNINILTLTTYDELLPVKVAFPNEKIIDPLAKILSDNHLTQGHFAESEKYAHVTYFFNGGNIKPNPGETWKLVPSLKVKSYDMAPEMSADNITNEIFKALKAQKLDFVLVNYANCDLVGHTGNYEMEIKAVEAVDNQLKRLLDLLPETTIMVTADHGNGESMIDPETKEIDKKHTINPVPFILINEKYKRKADPDEIMQPIGILADITPTILSFYGLSKTENMNGVDLTESL